MVIHKPAGVLTVPGKTEDLRDCVINRLLEVEPNTLLIHRLDRDTSGILVFGLSKWGAKNHFSSIPRTRNIKNLSGCGGGTSRRSRHGRCAGDL